MKSSLPGLFLLLSLSCTVSGLGSVLSKTVAYIQNYYTWQDAQTYCRRVYSDLVVLYDQVGVDGMYLDQYLAWISLQKVGNQWSVKLDNHIWDEEQPDEGCAYINYQEQQLHGTDCGEYYFSFCSASPGDKYVFVNESLTWWEAEQRCLTAYDGLGVVNDQGHLNAAAKRQDFPVWIGLRRNGGTWQWSAGVSNYSNWAPREPGNDSDCVTISSTSKTMMTQNCSARYPFVCFQDNLLLVKENRTWEEALDYCTTAGAQLVSVQPGEYTYMRDRALGADTDQVWTGLRYLAGSWFWVNGADLAPPDLPPIELLHCGALSKNELGSLEARDCLEEKNFLCYTK